MARCTMYGLDSQPLARVEDDGTVTYLVSVDDPRLADIADEIAAVASAPAPGPAPELPLAAEVQAARDSLAAATTVTQTKSRALALDDLRGQQLAAITNGGTP